MSIHNYSQLSLMMFFQYFIWGAWFVTLGTYLAGIGFTGTDIGYAYLMNNIGAIISPLIIGFIADRFFASEKVLAVLHLAGGAILFFMADFVSASAIILSLLIYNALYMPTLALTNTITLTQVEKPDQHFPRIRVWGTLGWVASGLMITFVLGAQLADIEASSLPMKLAAGVSILFGLFSFTLPHTPAPAAGKRVQLRDIIGLNALVLFKDRSFSAFAVSSLLISIPLAYYYAFTNLFLNEQGMSGVAATMSLGQVSEVLFMVAMPFLFRRFGVKWMLLTGMFAWVIRYAFFASGDLSTGAWMLYSGILLHGICYDFFFVTGQIYVDKKADPAIRASAQSLIALLTYGVGLAIGSIAAGRTVDILTIDGVKDWPAIWWTPCILAALVAFFFTLAFKDESEALEKVSSG
ncbi:MAG: nucleoside permease [Pseudomonadota bacterium]